MIEPRAINGDTVNALIALAVKTSQMRLVASNAITIAQAAYQPGAWLRGLWVGNTPVGLLAMIDLDHPSVTLDEGDPRNTAYVWRLMVDQYQQGKGYGRQAMQIARNTGREWGKSQLVLSVVPAERNAFGFYEKFGLKKTGRMVDDEVEMRMAL